MIGAVDSKGKSGVGSVGDASAGPALVAGLCETGPQLSVDALGAVGSLDVGVVGVLLADGALPRGRQPPGCITGAGKGAVAVSDDSARSDSVGVTSVNSPRRTIDAIVASIENSCGVIRDPSVDCDSSVASDARAMVVAVANNPANNSPRRVPNGREVRSMMRSPLVGAESPVGFIGRMPGGSSAGILAQRVGRGDCGEFHAAFEEEIKALVQAERPLLTEPRKLASAASTRENNPRSGFPIFRSSYDADR